MPSDGVLNLFTECKPASVLCGQKCSVQKYEN